MFTGIITDIGRVAAIEKRGDTHLWIESSYDLAAIPLGASISHDGVCLTVTQIEPDQGRHEVVASGETLSKTTLGTWQPGKPVNLELSLRLGDEIGGHLVYGHVDGLATVAERRPEGESVRFSFDAPDSLMPYIAPKGSVAVDGVSLTVNEVNGSQFGVNIIPHTLENTRFSDLQPGGQVNLEIDMLARYAARILATRHGEPGA